MAAGWQRDPLALKILYGESHGGDTIHVDVNDEALTFARKRAEKSSKLNPLAGEVW